MKLVSLRVEHFRQFRQPAEIRDLQSGINLFTGPNESGKSTLVRAIRAAFFERFRSSSVDDLQPWGDSSVAPSVELEFEWQGERWHLNKSFLRHKRCDLQVGSRAFNGEEAEEQLSSLLGYEFPGRGASRAENWGIPGLLWVEQGAGQELNEAVSYAGDHLQSALGESLGELASSSGDELISVVETERNKLRTASTGRPTGELARANQAASELQAQRDELAQKAASYRQQVDRLGALLGEQREDEQRPWELYRQQASEAQQRLDEVSLWQREQEREQHSLQQAEQSHSLCVQHLQEGTKLQDELGKRQRAAQSAKARLLELQGQELPMQERLTQAREHCQKTREQLTEARQQAQRRTLCSERTALEQQLADWSQKLGRARECQQELLQLREKRQTIQIAESDLKRLRKLVAEQDRIQASREAVATRLSCDLLPGQTLQLDGESLSGQTQHLLLSPAQVDIPGVGRLQISPGGEDLLELELRQQQVREDVESLLKAMQLTSLAEAEQRSDKCRELTVDVGRLELQLSQLAPEGVEALAEMLRLGAMRQTALNAQIADIAEQPGFSLAVEVAEADVQHALEAFGETEQAVSAHRLELALASQESEAAESEWQRLHTELNSPERQQREQQLRQQLIELQTEQQRLQQLITERQQQIENARPEILAQDVMRLTNSAKALEEAAVQRKLEVARLQSSLEVLGAQALDEQLANVEQELELTVRRQAELIRRADALDLLLELLTTKRHALTQRLQAPLQKHLNRYLQLLFPQAQLNVDEHLIPTQLLRQVNGSAECGDIAALSFGAREQMGLISRLAYADLLQEAGRPTLIILDDALVHSDQTRLAQMKRVLFDAAQRHQILLFSCHPEDWRDLGVVPRDMDQLRG
ncbi:MAG: GTP-binding protein [Aquipseudomonas alcaligenes]|uniref:GTP-binding protein n=1 Tax=Aquipseudomonas alcaligenes TaxID=43263 RepID=A0A5C7VMI8_AQUAC|nr:MAG: GTP-binding protein [Pseudomonas alcaligenes]